MVNTSATFAAGSPPPSAGAGASVGASATQTEWQGPWSAAKKRRGRRFRALLWALLFPPRGERIAPTMTGVLLITISLGIGTAAYNTASNILFITLSLLLSCLVLSGVLSWLNLRAVTWRLLLAGPWRAGQAEAVALELRNDKTLFPTYGLWFDLAAGEAAPERRHLETRLDPGTGSRMEWLVKATRRGRMRIGLRSMGSLYPFGFLRKSVLSDLGADVLVWPSAVEYRREGEGTAWRAPRGRGQVNRAGQDGDLLALRRYSPGDSPKSVHWKASARLRHLMVRQFSTEGVEGFVLRMDPEAGKWPRAEQFELALSLAATLAEDLFRLDRLQAVAIGDEPAQTVRRRRDVEAFLDRLALLEPVPPKRRDASSPAAPQLRRVLTIEPQGPRGVAALIDGKPAATA
jgi:uncharacterized protein (DUF58 family)